MNCQVCRGSTFNYLFKREGLILIICSGCGLVQIDNISTVFDIANYDYYKHKVTLTQRELYNDINTKRFVTLLTKLERYRKNNALLDIGCGEGHFLSVAKKMNWEAKGVEIAPYAVEICKKFNIDAACDDFLKLDLKHNYYDIVTMFEVLEHLTKPREFLFKANDVLREEGILLITTPNFNCINRLLLQKKWRLIHKEHLFYFTPNSIKRLLKETHFKVIEFRTKDITLPELVNIFFNKPSNIIYSCNQALRRNVEENKILLFAKKVANIFLNLIERGESIQCICKKI